MLACLPRTAIAPPSAVPISARYCRCGRHDRSRPPSAYWRRLCARIGPARTAKTPAFGRASGDRLAISPLAKTAGWLRLCNVGLTAMKPRSSVARPDPAISAPGATAETRKQASNSWRLLSARVSDFLVMRVTDCPRCRSQPTARRHAARRVAAASLICGSRRGDRLNSAISGR